MLAVGHTVTVLREGRVVRDGPTGALTTEDLIRATVGRDAGDLFPRRDPRIGKEALSIRGPSAPGLDGAGVTVRQGGIVGLFDLAGSGRTALLRGACGADRRGGGTVMAEGRPSATASPRSGVGRGLGLVSEDGKTQGLLNQGLGFNVMSASLGRIRRGGRPAVAPRRAGHGPGAESRA